MAFRIAALALRVPFLFLMLIAGLSVSLAFGLPHLKSQSYLEGSLDDEDAELLRYRTLEREFGSDRMAILAIGCDAPMPCQSVFDPEALRLIRDLSTLASAIPEVQDVHSLATAGILVGSAGTLRAEQLADPLTTSSVDRFRSLVVGDPTLIGTIISEDLRTTSVIVRFDPRLTDADRNNAAIQLIEGATALAKEKGFELFVSGDVPFAAITDHYVKNDLAYLTPIMIGLLAIFLVWVFRDPLSVILALATVSLPALWVFGLMGWTGSATSPITSMLPILILIVGVTDALHFLVRVHDLRTTDMDIEEIVLEVAQEVGPPTSVTALTAALGFLSLLAGDIPSIRHFGVFAAVGIASGWLLTFTLIPILLVKFRVRARPEAPFAFQLGDRILDEIRRVAHQRAYGVLTIAGLALIVSLYGISQVVPQNDSLKIIGPEDLLFRSMQFIDHRLRPTASIEVTYEVEGRDDLFEPKTLRKLEEIESILMREGDGAAVISMLPILRLAHREVARADLELPLQRQVAAQLMLLAEMPNAGAIRRVLTPDHKVARLSGGYRWGTAQEIQTDLQRIRQSLEDTIGDHASWSVTGSIFLAAHMGSLILDTQIASFSTAFLTIFLVIFLFIRSVRLGLLGMIPNVFPIVVILGFMGLASINLDVATAMIASIVLGISVDDTMYFLIHYKKARLRGAGVRDAVTFTFSVAGKPAIFSSTVLAMGFFVLGFSSFQSLAIFGLLAGNAVLLAGIAELFLMPAVLEVVSARRRSA